MTVTTLLLITILLWLLLFRTGYLDRYHAQENSPLSGPDDFVIQFDDYGRLWKEDEALTLIETIRESLEATNTIVVIFAHGWHHNASPSDSNVRDFHESLMEIRTALDDEHLGKDSIYSASRKILTGNADARVIGVYIGWRGQSLPCLLNYLTFWGRKNAAERVGTGDLRALLLRLDILHREQTHRREKGLARHFMGMASIGHSFGGQVLFRSVESRLEETLIEATTHVEQPIKNPLVGFGDVTVLLNPALEAFQYENIRRLAESLTFDSNQTPLLLVLSAPDDLARFLFFPVGRLLGCLFRPPMRMRNLGLWITALGEHKSQITHDVSVNEEDTEKPLPDFDPCIYRDDPEAIMAIDLTDIPTIGGLRLTPRQPHSPHNPFLVAHAAVTVIVRHSGIFRETLRRFLKDYIAITQGKRMLLSTPQARRTRQKNSS